MAFINLAKCIVSDYSRTAFEQNKPILENVHNASIMPLPVSD